MRFRVLCAFFAVMVSLTPELLVAESPAVLIQQVVASERAANAKDRANWTYLEESRKPKEQVLQWVGSTQTGAVDRVLRRDGQAVPEAEQREIMERYLRDGKAQKKQVAENAHDLQQIDDFLKLLPEAFLWTQTSATATSTTLHFEPNRAFHPPTRESRVFSEMSGDLVFDNEHLRVRSMTGRLARDVTFGGGLLGRLKEGSSFALEQEGVGEGYWELTAIHVHLVGNALLFKSVSLEQDDLRSRYELQASSLTPEQAMELLMRQPVELSASR